MKAVTPLALLFLSALLMVGCGGASETEQSPDGAENAATDTVAPATTPPPSVETPVASGPAEHDGSRTLRHIEELAKNIGSRVAGTSGEKQAVEYISHEFEGLGYSVELMEFDFDGFGSGSITAADGSKELTTMLLSGSAAGEAKGPAVFVGLGDAAGIAGTDLRGAVAIADRGTVRFGEKYENVVAAGAVALVVVNNSPGLFGGSLGLRASIPVLGASDSDRQRLLALAETRQVISVKAEASARSVDVIARPAAGARCNILIGGHHDSVPGVEGATDNASGTAMTLELARAMAADGLDEGVCFATFGAEESGLFGSAALVQKWQAEGTLPKFMLNLDVVGTGTTIELIGDDALRAAAEETAAARGYRVELSQLPAGASSDHASFEAAGVRVLFLSSDDFSDIHTPADTYERIDTPVLEDLGDLAYEMIQRLEERVAQP